MKDSVMADAHSPICPKCSPTTVQASAAGALITRSTRNSTQRSSPRRGTSAIPEQGRTRNSQQGPLAPWSRPEVVHHRGRTVFQPLPDPAEDDGRKLSNLFLTEVATAITEQHAPYEAADFLAEEGIPPQDLTLPDGIAPADTHEILAAPWRWGSEGRRMVRRFIGRWQPVQPDAMR
jgi:hypothetical protein